MNFDCREEYTHDDIKDFGSEEIYRKFVNFKQMIDVDCDKNLRWCPKVGCLNYVKREKKCCNSNNQQCACGQNMCFKCGAVSHKGVSCNNVGDAELRNYMILNGVVKCPKCGFGTEKIDGCNHMTCTKCKHDWCWLCRGNYSSKHFEPLNIFGCPGGQFQNDNYFISLLLRIGLFLAIPFILFFGPSVYLIWLYSDIMKPLRNIFGAIFFLTVALPICFVLGSIVGAVALAILLLPAFIF